MESDANIKSTDDVYKKIFLYYFVFMLQSSRNVNLTLNFPILGSPNTIFSIYNCKTKVKNVLFVCCYSGGIRIMSPFKKIQVFDTHVFLSISTNSILQITV